jgi:hypothetical protein
MLPGALETRHFVAGIDTGTDEWYILVFERLGAWALPYGPDRAETGARPGSRNGTTEGDRTDGTPIRPTQGSNTMKTAFKLTLVATTALLVLGGCKGKDETSYSAIAGDLTPEMQGTTARPIDVDRYLAYMKNQNMRSLHDDLGRMFYTDHPSRLSPFPIVDTSGQPR